MTWPLIPRSSKPYDHDQIQSLPKQLEHLSQILSLTQSCITLTSYYSPISLCRFQGWNTRVSESHFQANNKAEVKQVNIPWSHLTLTSGTLRDPVKTVFAQLLGALSSVCIHVLVMIFLLPEIGPLIYICTYGCIFSSNLLIFLQVTLQTTFQFIFINPSKVFSFSFFLALFGRPV